MVSVSIYIGIAVQMHFITANIDHTANQFVNLKENNIDIFISNGKCVKQPKSYYYFYFIII